MNKQQAFEKWTWMNNTFWTSDYVTDIQEEVDRGVCDLHKSLIGRKCSDPNKAYQNLVKKGFLAEYEEFVKPYRAESNTRYENLTFEKKTVKNELIEWAKQNPVMPYSEQEKTMIKKAHGGDWHTQGFGANKYAKNSLADDFELLKMLGYEPEIKAIDGYTSKGYYPQYYENYELWAKISEFDFWCLRCSGNFISVLNWCVNLWNNGSNPKVYFPFLSDDDYEKSQYLAYHTNYEVTKENMRLELSWDEILELYPRKS